MKVECKEEKHVSYTKQCDIDKYCCRKMKKALTIEEYSNYCSHYYRNMKIDKCGIFLLLLSSEYASKSKTYISYCPFCGEEIE